MNHDELKRIDKSYKKLKIVRIVAIPIVILLAIANCCGMIYMGVTHRTLFFVLMLLLFIPIGLIIPIIHLLCQNKKKTLITKLESAMLESVGLSELQFTDINDTYVGVNSKKAVANYDDIKFFKDNPGELWKAADIINQKREYASKLNRTLKDGEYKGYSLYPIVEDKIKNNLKYTNAYCILVQYISPAGRSHDERYIPVSRTRITQLQTDKSLLMSKSEYNKYLKEQGKIQLEEKQHSYYERVNSIVDLANEHKDNLVIDSDSEDLDRLVYAMFDRTVNSIKKVKSIDSEEWDLIDKFMDNTEQDVKRIIERNDQIIEYYNSSDFAKIKNACDNLMSTQREFNEYIDEKVKSISSLFGTNIVRNETTNDDVFDYIHPYKKSITPFTAEVSATVFASAENSPLEYIVKNFYPNKTRYPEQIQKLHLLIEELETLKEAKQIIENYKEDVQQYLTEVPSFVMEYDESGFYSRLGFATINENVLTVEYKFSYTSNGGRAQRSFTVPMTEDTIVSLIQMLESKLTMSAFTKEQRSLMTSKLRQQIKERDDYTCKYCGNSTHKEPNLLLEIDHIIPVAKGGCTEVGNLQTLCWKCNRQKGSKTIA